MDTIGTSLYHAPCGDLLLGAFKGRLCLCDWRVEAHREAVDRRVRQGLQAVYAAQESDILRQAARELDEYFAGSRQMFEVPLLFVGTPFQKAVWDLLLTIPYGKTLSYGEMARRLDRPAAVRAVARANGANALSIFVPCHRVIGSDGSLTGYGGGLPAKRFLLAAESLPALLSWSADE